MLLGFFFIYSQWDSASWHDGRRQIFNIFVVSLFHFCFLSDLPYRGSENFKSLLNPAKNY